MLWHFDNGGGEVIFKREDKPCPFCGSDHIGTLMEEVVIQGKNYGQRYYAYCISCYARTHGGNTVKDALAQWNTRTP